MGEMRWFNTWFIGKENPEPGLSVGLEWLSCREDPLYWMKAQSKYKTWIKQGSSQERGQEMRELLPGGHLGKIFLSPACPNSSKNVNLEQFSKDLCLFLMEMSLKDCDLWKNKKYSLFSLKQRDKNKASLIKEKGGRKETFISSFLFFSLFPSFLQFVICQGSVIGLDAEPALRDHFLNVYIINSINTTYSDNNVASLVEDS